MYKCKHLGDALWIANNPSGGKKQVFEDSHLHQVLIKYNCKNLKQRENLSNHLNACKDILKFRDDSNVFYCIIIIISLLQYILGNFFLSVLLVLKKKKMLSDECCRMIFSKHNICHPHQNSCDCLQETHEIRPVDR